ncbi:unnamed protein product [Mytilus edulis]|uniref:Roc domain-containing protein n=1 Tax=Mytilus edulis TaxID=6550 RepID=A0A8S3SJC7_MYTED|nr:unnamed protein product [Mytilus edulis]
MSEKSSGVTAEQEIEDDVVPTEIKLMADKRSIDLYLKLLESGSEKKRDIRLVVVGKQGAGKTSLIRRLFGEDITDKNEATEALGRLLKEFEEQLQDKGTKEKPVESHMAIKDKRPAISYDESMKSETVSMQPKIIRPLEEPLVTPQQSSQSSEQAARDFETMLTAKSKVDRHDKEEYATFLLWDFAGDEEFYHTHQTFLSQDAMYLVVTKLNEADDSSAQALFRLWIDSIHCYSRLEEGNIISDDKTTKSGYLDPPIVIVGTWKDAVDASEAETVEKAYKESLLKYTNELADDERGHLRCEYFISNKDDECIVFQQIRQNILNLARGMRTWNIKYPLQFIQLEQRLQKKKEEIPIISYHEIKDISTNTPEPLSEEELILFLKFHHELRALVYFKDLFEYIILDTQWLSDTFRCIVTAQKFRINIRNQKEWNDLFQRGKLKNAVLEDIFKNETTIVYEHKDFILKVMEKFDIIIHPNKSENVDENPCYYVPCMIKEECQCDIYEMFKVPEDTRHRSTWLCFKFRFLPPHLMNHLIASLSRRYAIAQIQVLEFGKGIERGLLKDIADFVEMEVEKIIHTRFNMSNVKFEKKWECGLTKPEFVTGINDFCGEQMTEYYCETCIKTHKFVDEWSGLQTESLCFLHCSNDAEHSNPHLEPPVKNKNVHEATRTEFDVEEGRAEERKRFECANCFGDRFPRVVRYLNSLTLQKFLILVTIATVIIGLILLLAYFSKFVYVEYHEAPDKEFIRYPKYKQHNFMTTDVFTIDKLEITMSFHLQYYIRSNELGDLHRQYEQDYNGVLQNVARSEIKNHVGQFSLDYFRLNRTNLEKYILNLLQARFVGDCCKSCCSSSCTNNTVCATCLPADKCHPGYHVDIKYFQLTQISIPSEVSNLFVQQLVLQVEAEKEFLVQTHSLVQKETEKLTKKLKNEANEILEEAQANSSKKITLAEADREVSLTSAYVHGLKYLYLTLGVNNEEHQLSLMMIRALEDSNVKGNLYRGYGYNTSTIVSSPSN